MYFNAFLPILICSIAAAPAPPAAVSNQAPLTASGSTSSVPDIGAPAGDPNATADKLGPDGKTNVPGRCPPSQAELDAHLIDIHPETFAVASLGLDLESRIARYEQTLSGLQDLKCPAASTTLKPRLLALTALRGQSVDFIDKALAGLGPNDAPVA